MLPQCALLRSKQITELLSQRRLPEPAWDELAVDSFLREIAIADSNNFVGFDFHSHHFRFQVLMFRSRE